MDSSYTTKAQLRTASQRVAQKIDDIENKVELLTGIAEGIDLRVDSVEEDVSGLQTQVDGISVPTKTSDLINDSGFPITVNGVSADAAGDIKLIPIYIGAASNRNLLDNWYFANPINQRGKTKWTVEQKPATSSLPNVEYNFQQGYCIDRWKLYKIIVQIHDGYTSLSYGGGNNYGYIEQPLGFDVSVLANRSITYSVLLNTGTLYTWTFYITDPYVNHMESPIFDSKFLLAYYGGGRNAFIIYVYPSVVDAGVIATKAEFGTVQTLAHKDTAGNWVLSDPPPDKALELEKCQRHQCVIGVQSLGTSCSINAGTIVATAHFPVSMRAAPTVSWLAKAPAQFRNALKTYTQTDAAEIALGGFGDFNNVRMQFTTFTETLPIGEAFMSMGTGSLLFDANP